jgi:hypothetical protein
MARENQGLQYALIGSVVLTILLGVCTFLFYSRGKDTDVKLKTADRQAMESRKAAEEALAEVKELKRMLGIAETDKLNAISEQFNKDMETWAKTFPEKSRFYRPALEYVFTSLKTTMASLADSKKEIADWKDKYEQREASKDPEIKRHQQVAEQASNDLTTEREGFKGKLATVTKQQEELLAQMQEVKKEAETSVTKAEEVKTAVESKLRTAGTTARDLKRRLDEVTKDIPDRFDGSIRWVNQAAKSVWIDLGRLDGLSPQTTFAVYPGDTIDLSKAVRKARVEVTQVLNDHLSEARVLEASALDPIVSGDKLFTPVWKPGERRHFALAGMMDTDNDGRDDTRMIRNLITLNGGVIDAEIDPKTNKRTGQLTATTRYVVVGKPPESKGSSAKSASDAMNEYSKLLKEAHELGTEEIKVGELLNRMGWKTQARVVDLGPGGTVPAPSNDASLRRPAAETIFRNREAPTRAGTKTAY